MLLPGQSPKVLLLQWGTHLQVRCPTNSSMKHEISKTVPPIVAVFSSLSFVSCRIHADTFMSQKPPRIVQHLSKFSSPFYVVTWTVCLLGIFCPVQFPKMFSTKENNTDDSISYKADWAIRSSLLLATCHIWINPFFWSMLAMWLSTFFSGADHILLRWPGHE